MATKNIRWLVADTEWSNEIPRPAGTTLHAFLERNGGHERLCLSRQGEPPDAVHILDDRSFCASCIRRSLEIFR